MEREMRRPSGLAVKRIQLEEARWELSRLRMEGAA
jgi:hypothetical protein